MKNIVPYTTMTLKIIVFNVAYTSILIAASLPQLHKLKCRTIIIAN